MKTHSPVYFLLIVLLYGLLACCKGQPAEEKGSNHLDPHQIEQFVLHQMDTLDIPGISIAIFNKEEVFYAKNLGLKNLETQEKVDSQSLFEACSLTKPVFAYTVIKLAAQGLLDLDTPLYTYLPNKDLAQDERYKLLTARIVLSHTSGLPNWREGKLTFISDPGTEFTYSGEAYEYLGSVIESLTGENLQEVIQREVFNPLNIKNSFFMENEYLINHMATGHRNGKVMGRNICKEPHMAYSLSTHAMDYSKLIMAFMKESELPQSTFHQMSEPHFAIDSDDTVCLGIFTEETPTGLQYYHSGNNDERFNSSFEFYVDRNIGYVYFINCNKRREFTKALEGYLGYY